MPMPAGNALRQASMTSHDYAMKALDDLVDMLGIDKKKATWRAQLAPFAPVWAAMIAAAAQDFDTAVRGGIVEGAGPNK